MHCENQRPAEAPYSAIRLLHIIVGYDLDSRLCGDDEITFSLNHNTMIDREARNTIVRGIDEFMDGICDSDELDGLLDLIYFETEDETIRNVRWTILLTYDFLWPDVIDVDLPKWKFLNRIRLLLQSDAELVVVRRRRWTIRQTFALLSLVAYPVLFLLSFVILGEGFALYSVLVLSVFFILTFISLGKYSPKPLDIKMNPFSNVREILAVRRTVPGFFKKPYPGTIAKRRHREPYYVSEIRTKPSSVFEWIFIPMILLSPILPELHEKREILLQDS